MIDWMANFTEADRKMIDDLARRNYADMTSAETELLNRWNAARDAANAAETERLNAAMAANAAATQAAIDAMLQSINDISALATAALERYANSIDGSVVL